MRRRNHLAMLLLFSSAVFCNVMLYAQIEVSIPPSKDNTLYESTTGTVSNGKGTYLFVAQNNHGEVRRALLAFDLTSTIPSAAVIQSAKLTLNMSRTVAGVQNVAVHRVLANWGEGESDALGEEGAGASAATGDATWIHTFFNTTRWANAGGDFASAASATQAVAGLGFYTWGSTPEMVADVQTWLNAPENNFGWMLLSNEDLNGSTKRFDSRQNLTAANRPKLTVIYSVTTSVNHETATLPGEFALQQNYPNPFNPQTTMRYDLPKPAHVRLVIYSLAGTKVRVLVDEQQTAGFKNVNWDGRDDKGERAASGVYLYRLQAEDFTAVRKLTLLK